MVFCCVRGCENNARKENLRKVTYHSLPANRERRSQWLSLIKRPDWDPPLTAKICSDHFPIDQLNLTYASGVVMLRENALPTLKLPTQYHPTRLRRRSTNSNETVAEIKQDPDSLESPSILNTGILISQDSGILQNESSEINRNCDSGMLENDQDSSLVQDTAVIEEQPVKIRRRNPRRKAKSRERQYFPSGLKNPETKSKHPDWFINSLLMNRRTVGSGENTCVMSGVSESPDAKFQSSNMGWILAKTEDENLELIPVMTVPDSHPPSSSVSKNNTGLCISNKTRGKQCHSSLPDISEMECKRLNYMLEACQEKLVQKKKECKQIQNAYRKLKHNHSNMKTIFLENKSKLSTAQKTIKEKRNAFSFSPGEMRDFSLKLFRISPEAYNFVREHVRSLPDTKTLNKWLKVSSVAAEGFITHNVHPNDGALNLKMFPHLEQNQISEQVVNYSEVSLSIKQNLNQSSNTSLDQFGFNGPNLRMQESSHEVPSQALTQHFGIEEQAVDLYCGERMQVASNFPSNQPQVVAPGPEQYFHQPPSHFNPEGYLQNHIDYPGPVRDHNYSVESFSLNRLGEQLPHFPNNY